MTLAEPAEQEDLTRAAVVLDGLMAGRTAADAERALARIDGDGADRRRSSGASASGSSPRSATTTATRHRGGLQRRPPARDGGARVRAERQAPAGLRRPREPGLPRRAVRLGRRERPRSRCSSAPRTAPTRCATSRSSSPRTASPAGPSASSACSGRPGWPTAQAIGTVRFVSGLMNELVAQHPCLTRDRPSTPRDRGGARMTHRTRAEERADEIDISPTKLLADIEPLTGELDAAPAEGRGVSRRPPARAGRVHATTGGGRREEREAMLGLAGEDLIRKVLALADDFDLAIDARPAELADDGLGRGRRRHRPQAAGPARERGRHADRGRARARRSTPASTRRS